MAYGLIGQFMDSHSIFSFIFSILFVVALFVVASLVVALFVVASLVVASFLLLTA